MFRYLALFVAILLGLSLVYNLDWVGQTLLVPWNHLLARTSYFFIQLMSHDAFLNGTVLYSTSSSFSVSVEADCNGLEATMILVAAVLAYPATLKAKLAGLTLGVLAVQGLNLTRIIMLFYFGIWNSVLFEWAHKYVWPVLIILGALIAFFVWIQFIATPKVARADGTTVS